MITRKTLKRSGVFLNRWKFSFYYDDMYIVDFGFTPRAAIGNAYHSLASKLVSTEVRELKSRMELFG